jgi:hypothetical protein
VDERTPEDELCQREVRARVEALLGELPAEAAGTLRAALTGRPPEIAPAQLEQNQGEYNRRGDAQRDPRPAAGERERERGSRPQGRRRSVAQPAVLVGPA